MLFLNENKGDDKKKKQLKKRGEVKSTLGRRAISLYLKSSLHNWIVEEKKQCELLIRFPFFSLLLLVSFSSNMKKKSIVVVGVWVQYIGRDTTQNNTQALLLLRKTQLKLNIKIDNQANAISSAHAAFLSTFLACIYTRQNETNWWRRWKENYVNPFCRKWRV